MTHHFLYNPENYWHDRQIAGLVAIAIMIVVGIVWWFVRGRRLF